MNGVRLSTNELEELAEDDNEWVALGARAILESRQSEENNS